MEDLIVTAWEAWRNIVFENQTIIPAQDRLLEMIGDSAEEILIESLREINYLYLVHGLIYQKCINARIEENQNQFILKANLKLGIFDPEKHQVSEEIKAVTYHRLKIEKTDKVIYTDVVFDI
jgi:SHS2 domain-containing protein